MNDKNVIRAVRGAFTNDDIAQLAALLVKYGYTVRITRATKPGKNSIENVIEYKVEAE
jgi:hypothetical protein